MTSQAGKGPEKTKPPSCERQSALAAQARQEAVDGVREGEPWVVVTSHLCVWQTRVLLKPQRLGAQALESGGICCSGPS